MDQSEKPKFKAGDLVLVKRPGQKNYRATVVDDQMPESDRMFKHFWCKSKNEYNSLDLRCEEEAHAELDQVFLNQLKIKKILKVTNA